MFDNQSNQYLKNIEDITNKDIEPQKIQNCQKLRSKRKKEYKKLHLNRRKDNPMKNFIRFSS